MVRSPKALRQAVGRIRELMTHGNNVLLALSFVIGILAGGAAIVLQESLRFLGNAFLGAAEPTTTDLSRVLLAPMIGGLIAGPLIM
jgi:hypothetical protein